MRYPGSGPTSRLALGSAFVFAAALVAAGFALATENGSTPTITGEARAGEVLTASDAALHRWQRCDPEAEAGCAPGPGNNPNGWSDIEDAQGAAHQAYLLGALDVGTLIRVLAKGTNTGTMWHASGAVGPVEPAGAEPPPPPPPPSFQQTGNLDPVAGAVLALVPGSKRWVAIEELTQVPMGTKIDVSEGRVDLVTQRGPKGAEQSVRLWGGAFALNQRRKKRITVMRLIHPGPGAGHANERVETARHRKRRLWGRGKCRCRHRGRNSSGTARGTWWVTVEKPRGTLTRVRKGRVLVRDFKRGNKVLVKGGQRYLARR